MSSHGKIVAGLVFGSFGGIAARSWLGQSDALDSIIYFVTQPLGQVYLRLLFMLIIPLVFSALTLGIVGVGEIKDLGRIGVKTLIYSVTVSSIAVVLGVTLVNVLQPGNVPDDVRAQLFDLATQRSSGISSSASTKSAIELLVGIVPDNVIKAASQGDMLAIMFFAVIFGIAMAMTNSAASLRFAELIQGLYDITWQMISMVMKLAPYGIAALMFSITAQLGVDILVQLLRYVGVVVLALAIHQFIVYSLIVRFFGNMRPLFFFRSVRDAMIIAFSTASSNASLPTSLRVAEENLHLPNKISRFILTVGSTANQNGTALFEGVSVLFLAQLYGVSLSLPQQGLVVMVCVLGGIGTAGVPAGSIPVVAMILSMIGVPIEAIGIILGVDRFLDMCRTTLNVTGDLAAAVVISHSESGELAPLPVME